MSLLLGDIALSVRQPWAWGIVTGWKDIENRSRKAVDRGQLNRRGRISIHAAKGMTREEYFGAAEFMRTIGVECPAPDALVRGAIVGAVDVVDCVKESESPWFFGPRGLVLRNPMQIGAPIPCSGQLGYFQWAPRAGGEIEKPAKWMIAKARAPSIEPVTSAPAPDLFSGDGS